MWALVADLLIDVRHKLRIGAQNWISAHSCEFERLAIELSEYAEAFFFVDLIELLLIEALL